MNLEDVGKSIIEKISSYNIFNYFLPGFIFCYLSNVYTNYSFDTGSVWKDLVIYYFSGLIISRISSIFIERILLKIKIRNMHNHQQENYVRRAPYEDYIMASEKCSFISTLNETNNMYLTMIGVFTSVLFLKIGTMISAFFVNLFGRINIPNDILFLCAGLLLFVISYKKQTDYIRKRIHFMTHSDGEGET